MNLTKAFTATGSEENPLVFCLLVVSPERRLLTPKAFTLSLNYASLHVWRIPLIKLHRHFLLIKALALNLSKLATNNQRLFKHCSDFLWAEPRHGNRYGHIL